MTFCLKPGLLCPSWRSAATVCFLALVAFGASAQDAAAPTAKNEPEAALEGALGLLASNSPAYAGAQERRNKLLPGFYLRYGRLTLTNASGFVTRGKAEVERGLGLALQQTSELQVNLALRFDGGRSESDSAALAGVGSVRATVRARLAATWRPVPPWRLGAAWSHDLLGHGGGGFGEISVAREHRFSAHTTGAAGLALSVADARYMKSYFGVDAAQAKASNYTQFSPQAGLRDGTLFVNLRSELGPQWVALAGASATQLMGPAAASPHTLRRTSVAINAGLARLF